MRTVTFLVLEGVDKGRVFRDLAIPVTINGRTIATLVIISDQRLLYARLVRYSIIVALLMLCSACISLLVSSRMRRWITDPSQFKPGVRMPPAVNSPDDLDAIVAYLERLR